MKYLNIVLILLASWCISFAFNVRAQEPAPRFTVITPGRSVGFLQLGDVSERAYEVFPRVGEYHMVLELLAPRPCDRKQETYFELLSKNSADGEFLKLDIYSAGGRIFKIAASTPNVRTAEGLGPGSLPEEVRQHYGQLRAFIQLKKGEKKKKRDRPVYWADFQQGIAFEFLPDKYDEKKPRRVARVLIFEAGGLFWPEGCIPPGWELRELRPYTFE